MSPGAPSPATVLEVFDTLAPPGTPLTTAEVADEFDCTARTIYNKLERLVAQDTIKTKKVGARGRVWWRPPERAAVEPTDASHSGAAAALSGLRTREGSRQTSAKLPSREHLYNVIFNQTFEFIGLLEPDGTLLDANDAALTFGGLTRDDVVGEPFWEAEWWQTSERTRSELKAAIDRAADGEFVRYDVEVQGSDCTAIIDFSLRPVRNDEGEVALLVPEGRDITELKEHERQLQRVDQLNTVIRTVVQTAAQAETRTDIAQTVCDTLREFDAYQASVIGEFSPAGDDFEPWATSGDIDALLEALRDTEAPPLSESIGAEAARTGEIQVQHDAAEVRYDYWQELITTHDIRSYAAIPLMFQESVAGVLVVYADRPAAFDQEKQRILTELGEIIGYALYALERKDVLDPTIELDFRSGQLAKLFQAETDATFDLTLDSVVPLDDGTQREFWTVDGLSPQRAHTVFANSFATLSEPRLLKTVGETARFQVTAGEDSIAAVFDRFDGHLQSITIQDDTATVTGRFPEVVDSSAVTEAIRDRYGDIELAAQRRLLTPTHLRQLVEEQLTDRQQTVLRLAYFGGYYGQPRLNTGEELAAELGITRQTVHHHLRQAESKVFSHLFEEDAALRSD